MQESRRRDDMYAWGAEGRVDIEGFAPACHFTALSLARFIHASAGCARAGRITIEMFCSVVITRAVCSRPIPVRSRLAVLPLNGACLPRTLPA